MSLKQKIQEDSNRATKEKNVFKILVLRMLLAAILNKEKEKRYNLTKTKPELFEEELKKESQLTDEETTQIISFEIKTREDSISEFEKGKREDLAEKEKNEIEILKEYFNVQ